jgi:glucokinase
MNSKIVLGVDIGGTKVAAGLVNENGEILSKTRVPMIVNGSAEVAMACVHRAMDDAMRSAAGRVHAIGVSSPGPLDLIKGIVLKTPNLPCWQNFPLLSQVEHRYGLPTLLDNDANAAGLAEALWGAGKDSGCVFYATIGTGIGTAIIQDKRIHHGRTGAAAEGGHMTIDFDAPVRCGCGKPGCVEGMASGPALSERARQALLRDESRGSALFGLGSITAEVICDASNAGDPLATRILEETAELLAVWLGNVIDLIEPEVIVVGGGLGIRMASFFGAIQSNLSRWTINPRAHEIALLPAKFGADSGIAGSAALWLADAELGAFRAGSAVGS